MPSRHGGKQGKSVRDTAENSALEAGGGAGRGRVSPDPPDPALWLGDWPQGVGLPGRRVPSGSSTPGSVSASPSAFKAKLPLPAVGQPHSEGIWPFVPAGPTVGSHDTHNPPQSRTPRASERPNAASVPCPRPQGAQGELPAHTSPPGAPLWVVSRVPTLILTLTRLAEAPSLPV